MKEFFVTLGGEERKVRFTSADGKALKRRFGKPLRELFFKDVLGCDDAGRMQGTYDLEALHAAITLGINAANRRKVSEDQVSGWCDEHMSPEAGGNLVEIAIPVVEAAFYSGIVVGRSVDLRFESGAEGEGKEQPPAPGPETVKAAE